MTVDSPVVQLESAAARGGLVALLGRIEFEAADVESLASLGEGEEAEVRSSAEGVELGVMFVDLHDSGDPEDAGPTVGPRGWRLSEGVASV